MAAQANNGAASPTNAELWMARALRAEMQCDEQRDRVDYWKNRAIDAEIRCENADRKLREARKDLDDANKQLKRALRDLLAQRNAFVTINARAYDLLMSAIPEGRPTP